MTQELPSSIPALFQYSVKRLCCVICVEYYCLNYLTQASPACFDFKIQTRNLFFCLSQACNNGLSDFTEKNEMFFTPSVIPSSLQFYQTVGPRASGEDAGFTEKGAVHNAGEVRCQPQVFSHRLLPTYFPFCCVLLTLYYDILYLLTQKFMLTLEVTQSPWLLCTCMFVHIYTHTHTRVRAYHTCFQAMFLLSLQLGV